MAATPTVAKPRRGASPSDCNGIGTRRTPSSSEKPVPNYLRPTVSSRGETLKEVKKKAPVSSPDNAARKPVLARRSSLDRPPAASHLQKIISSSPGERSVTVRSSSFSTRSGNLSRPVAEKTTAVAPSRTAKAVSRTHLGNNVGGKAVGKKSSPTASGSSSLAAKNKEKPADAPAVDVDDASSNDNSVADGEKLASPTKEVTEEVLEPLAEAENFVVEHEDLEVVKEERHHVAHSENDVEDKEEIHADNGVIPVSKEEDENSIAAAQPQMEEVHEEIKDKAEIVSDDSKGEEKEEEVPEGVAEVAETEDKPVVEAVEVTTKEEKEAVEAAEEAEDSAGSEKQKEGKEVEVVNGEEEKQAAVAAAAEAEKAATKQRSEKPTTVASAKKDPAQANNDIIEETTKKLMESSRKNKVKALAGAFETVISLEKPGQV